MANGENFQNILGLKPKNVLIYSFKLSRRTPYAYKIMSELRKFKILQKLRTFSCNFFYIC